MTDSVHIGIQAPEVQAIQRPEKTTRPVTRVIQSPDKFSGSVVDEQDFTHPDNFLETQIPRISSDCHLTSGKKRGILRALFREGLCGKTGTPAVEYLNSPETFFRVSEFHTTKSEDESINQILEGFKSFLRNPSKSDQEIDLMMASFFNPDDRARLAALLKLVSSIETAEAKGLLSSLISSAMSGARDQTIRDAKNGHPEYAQALRSIFSGMGQIVSCNDTHESFEHNHNDISYTTYEVDVVAKDEEGKEIVIDTIAVQTQENVNHLDCKTVDDRLFSSIDNAKDQTPEIASKARQAHNETFVYDRQNNLTDINYKISQTDKQDHNLPTLLSQKDSIINRRNLASA